MTDTPIRILLLEDNAADAELARLELKRAGMLFTLQVVEKREAFIRELTAYLPDVIISDYTLPAFSGLEALEITLRHDEMLPFILWTGSVNEQTAVYCMKSGAADYVLKDHVYRLPVAVKGALEKRRAALEQKKTILLLQESEERFRRLSENAVDIIYLYSIDPHSFVYINPACTSISGYTPQEHYADPYLFFKIVHPDDLQNMQEMISRKVDPKKVLTVRWITKDGRIIWVEQRFVPIRDDEGNLLYVEGITRDITDRILYEENISRRHKITTALYKASIAFREADSLGVMLALFLNEVATVFNAASAALCMHDEEKNKLCFTNTCGSLMSLLTKEVEPDQGILGQVFQTNQPVIASPSSPGRRSFIELNEIDVPDSITAVCYPIHSAETTVGLLLLFIPNEQISEPELNLLASLAEMAGVAIHNARLLEKLREANLELQTAYDATIEGWAHALDLRDRETEGHSRRVTEMAVTLAKAMGIHDNELTQFHRGALLHDIGKIALPDAILRKPAQLTASETEIMRQHPQLAQQMLSHIKYLTPAIQIPLYHHERWDGSGYPENLQGEQIPLPARIFAVVDVFDALTSHRPYRPAWTEAAAWHYIQEQRGRHFDPQVVDLFFEIFVKQNTVYEGI